MKTLFAVLVLLSITATNAEALLIDRGGGMIYDTDRDITWLQEMNYAYVSGASGTGIFSWYEAQAWAEALVFGGFDDWRLPSMLDASGTESFTDNEIAHVYYTELGNTSFNNSNYWPFQIETPVGTNLLGFWLSETNAGDGGYFHWDLGPGSQFGFTDGHPKNGYVGAEAITGMAETDGIAWAVRSGDVALLPEPGTFGLLGLAVPLWMGFRARKPRCTEGREKRMG